MSTKRPVIKLRYSTFEIIMETIAALAVVLGFLVIFIYWKQIPDRIITHYNLYGKPDSWGGKGSLFIAPIIAVAMYLLLSLISMFPQAYNYSIAITEENAKYQYGNARKMMISMKAEIVVFFAFMSCKEVSSGLGKSSAISGIAIIVFLVLLIGTLIYFIKRMSKSSNTIG